MHPKDFGPIGVLMGGYSSEREISLKSGRAVCAALEKVCPRVDSIDITFEEEDKILSLLKEAHIDVAFIALHGLLGEDGTIQRILEKANIPYVGSGVKASQLAINKALTQSLLKKNGILVPPYVIVKNNEYVDCDKVLSQLGPLPLVVKPACEGSSIGITLVKDKKDFIKALTLAQSFGHEALVERFIKGRELTVGILNNEALPVVEIVPKAEFFDFTSKYQKGASEYQVPAALGEPQAHKIQETALKVFHLMGCRDLARIDFILDTEGQAFVLEINTIPGFTETSLLPKAAQERGYSFEEVCLKLIELAYEKKRQNFTAGV